MRSRQSTDKRGECMGFGERDDPLDAEIAIDAMMALASEGIGEEPEEQEYVASPDALIHQMGLRGAALPESAPASDEHRIFMTEMIAINTAAGHAFHDIAQPEILIAGR